MTGQVTSTSTQRRDQVEGALGRLAHAVAAEAFGEDDPARIQHIEMHPAGLALEEAHEVDDLDAGEAAVEQLAQRELAAAVVHRDDDLVDARVPWRCARS